MKDNDLGRRASAEPALVASLPEPQSVSAHSGDGQAQGFTIAVCGHSHAPCEHEFRGWRAFDDGSGGEQVCAKCGMGAMAHTLSLDF